MLPSPSPSEPRGAWWGFLLVAAVALVYGPVLWAGYIWDDQITVTANPVIIGPLGFKEIWTTSAAQFYPLVVTTFWLEHALWGLDPAPYHIVTVLWHAAAAIALWRVLRVLEIPGAWLGAALWALHPVNVESVAWITEMKNTESAFFYLVSILFFLRWLKAGQASSYTLSFFFVALAMAGKSSTVILPLVLGLGAWWVEGRVRWRTVLGILPMFLLSAIFTRLGLERSRLDGVSLNPQWATTWPHRIAQAGDAIWFYLGKLAWPHPLIALYPQWRIDTGSVLSYLPAIAVIVLLALLWRMRASWGRGWFFAFAYFLVALLPALGFSNFFILRYAPVFDHFQYLAGMGPLALAGAVLTQGADKIFSRQQGLRVALAAGLLTVLGIVSWQRTWAFTSSETLWTITVAQDPGSWEAHDNLGAALAQRGAQDAALAQYRMAWELNPTEDGYELALLKAGRVDEAVAGFRQAVAWDPGEAITHNNLGLALAQKGETDAALAEFRAALAIDPDHGRANYHLGSLLLQLGQRDEALRHLEKAATVLPNDVEVLSNLGAARLQAGQVDEAIVPYQRAVELDPEDAGFRCNLGIALFRNHLMDGAIEQFRAAIKIDPALAEAHCYLGIALLRHGNAAEAVPEFQRALQIRPDFPQAKSSLQEAQAALARAHP